MIELTEIILDSPKKYQHITFTYNSKENHSLESRLNRINLSKGKLKKALVPVMIKIKNGGYKNGTYGFVFPEFKMVANYHPKEKMLHIITFLTKEMRQHEFKVLHLVKILNWFK